ncbi:ubiquitin carboxyl-terminal hydrolase 16 isoform X1 [Pygocentrus nattereri]|uniref:ubiquitin carboxyl-terminal hydrolase 16 isoform X1 n=1 Tax=Pygocentrus nattereri TaxID=42514 RepID=UPI0018917DE5|nr:ubiquitin carboxyl-terminal hydrolase 16 isoform X1 [Pygocentrus nattereri]
MGKKRGKDRSPRGESSVDLSGATCTHIRKGIDHSLLKKISLDKPWTTCQACEEEKPSNGDAQAENKADQEGPAVWMCLKCGHRGCGRFSENQHAVKHYEKPRSDTHCLVLSLDSWSVWCYLCDDDVHYSSTGQLAQLVSNIKKQVLAGSSQKTSTRKVKEENSVSEVTMEEAPEKEQENTAKQKEQKKATKQNGAPKESPGGSGCGAVAVKGFSNLGNTCFFNAVLQNLSQTVLLRRLLSEVKDEQSSLLLKPPLPSRLDPLEVQLPKPGSLTLAMCQLLNEIQQTQKSVVTPRELFTQVCKKAARFKGFQQQDSQELLRYLLDGMRSEESTRVTAGILEALKSSGKSLDEEQKKIAKDYERNGGGKNFVDRVFGGEMTSTVMCQECKTVSLVTEVFLDLSLPVADEAYRKKNQKKGVQQKSSVSEDRGKDTAVPLANGDEDMPTGAGSKYQLKKAKKQAKKQAKNQRRQQKQGAKLTLDVFTNHDTDSPSEAPPTTADGQLEAGDEGEVDQDKSQSVASDPAVRDQDGPADEEEEEEESKEASERDAASSVNRYSALTEERANPKVEQDGGEDEESETNVPLNEEDELADGVNALSLQAADEESLDARLEEKASGDAVEYVVVNQDPELAFCTLASRAAPDRQECSVESCLYQFTEVEHLTQSNSLLCVTCTKRQAASKASDGSKKNVYREALKQMLISAPPPVLTLHLKRFQQVSYSVCKVNRHVQFPQVLDLSPFCSTNCKGVEEGETQVLYSLYGIVEHSGTMRSGHYTAFVKTRPQSNPVLLNGAASPGMLTGETAPPKGSWFHISDSSVQPVTEAKVQSAQAYLLFYERIS